MYKLSKFSFKFEEATKKFKSIFRPLSTKYMQYYITFSNE